MAVCHPLSPQAYNLHEKADTSTNNDNKNKLIRPQQKHSDLRAERE